MNWGRGGNAEEKKVKRSKERKEKTKDKEGKRCERKGG